MNREKRTFKKGSVTFFTSSLFFPRSVREDVFDLYSFVRTADDYVDQAPPNGNGFYQLRRIWDVAAKSQTFDTSNKDDDAIDLRATKNMLRVARKHKIDLAWVEAFLDAMQSDLIKNKYQTIDDTLSYVYGSAEVIGLMMSRIMDLPEEANTAAMMQGRAMQMINFIRDLEEDNQLSRQYFPDEDLQRFNLKDLSRQTAQAQPEEFNKFIQFQISRYKEWQTTAEEGYKYIPKRLRISVQTAADMYKWTAKEIEKRPITVFEKKIKPTKPRILKSILTNIA